MVGRMDVRPNDTTAAKYQVGDYRYQYIMPESFVSWGDSLYAKTYAAKSQSMGIKSAFVWYNLGKVSESQVAQNLDSTAFMTDYVSRYENFLSQIASVNQKDYIIVLEPDMYGLLLQGGYAPNLSCADIPVKMAPAAAVTGSSYTSDLCGWANYVIGRAKQKLTNGVIIGHMMNHWGINIPFQVGQGRIEAHIMSGNAEGAFLNSFGNYKGDVVFVEKTDRDAGVKATSAPDQDWFWDTANYAKYFTWAKVLSTKTSLRIVGWQVSEGNMNHPVTAHRDDAAQYFLDHPAQWADAGFIGILFGPGASGNANYGDDDDTGWFLDHFKAYGTSTYSLPQSLSIHESHAASGLLVQAREGGLTLSGWDGVARIRVFDLGGRQVADRSLRAGDRVGSLARGLYLIDAVGSGWNRRATALVP
jgi:hypothetical protein